MISDSQVCTEMGFESLALSIGATPLLAIQCDFRGRPRTVFAKAEHLNLSGSLKDRVALHVLHEAYEAGAIHPESEIALASIGNMGVAFSAVGRALGHPVTVFVPDGTGEGPTDLLRRFGARIVPVGRKEGGLLGSRAKADEMAEREGKVFLPHRSPNTANRDAHETSTGPEIWYQLKSRGLTPDAFVAGVGSGGTVMGVGRFLRSRNPAVQVHPLEPAESPTLSTGVKVGTHRIHGISNEFIPDILELDSLDWVIQVSDGDAIRMARSLEDQLGLGVGISSGANFLGALLIQEELGSDVVVATVFPDGNSRYLDTDTCSEEPIGYGFISPEVELRSYDTIRRSCLLCSDLDECQPALSLSRRG